MLTRINVPLFIMISGALLLKKHESVELVMKKRFLRFFIVLILCSICFYLMTHSIDEGHFTLKRISISEFVVGLLNGNLNGLTSYWYIYGYLGFLLILPFLQKLSKLLNKQEISFLVYLCIIQRFIIPFLVLMCNLFSKDSIIININISFLFIDSFVFYPLMGYYLDNVDINKITKRQFTKYLILVFLMIMIEIFCSYIEAYRFGEFTQNYVQMFDYLIAVFAFLSIKKLYLKCFYASRSLNTVLTSIGKLTFGMYLFDPFLYYLLGNTFNTIVYHYMPLLPLSILWCLFSMTICGLFTFFLKKLPYINKLL